MKVQKQTSVLDVNDVVDVLEQNNFSNQQQIEVLHILSYALHKKHYLDDTCGLIDRKIRLLEQAEHPAAAPAPDSNLRLSTKKGFKVNFIRVINCLCELSFFTDCNGNHIAKKDLFLIVGRTLHIDLSAFHNDLSTTQAAANRDLKNITAIFHRLLAKQIEISTK